MIKENDCCGNCKHFKNEDSEGWGYCHFKERRAHCGQSWECHNSTYNGWTEITLDNVDDVPDLAVVTDGKEYRMSNQWHLGVGTMAKVGGYYYYVLPEFKIE